MTPIHIDPENPAMPISHPDVYSIYLAKKQGPFATLGLAEDTWALNERVIDEQAFFEQAMAIYEERERMFLDALAQTKKGLRDDGLRHHRPRPAHVLPLPRPDPPGERRQGHRPSGRTRSRGSTSGWTRCSAGSGTRSSGPTRCSW